MYRLSLFPVQCFFQKLYLRPRSFYYRSISYYQKRSRSTRQFLVDKEKHKIVYHFYKINWPTGILKFNRILPITFLLFCPLALYFDILKQNIALTGLSTSLQYAFISLSYYYFLPNIVGIMYVNKIGDIKEVVVCSLSFSGKRIDRIHKPEDLIVIGFKNNFDKALNLITVKVKDSDLCYKFSTKFYNVYDKSAFKSLIGSF